jgi:hypothetical protein
MRWDQPLLTSNITHFDVHDDSLTPLWSLADVLAAFRRMPYLEHVNYIQKAALRVSESAADDVRLQHVRTLSVDMPLDGLVAFCPRLIPYNPDGCKILLADNSDVAHARHDIQVGLRRAATPLRPYLQPCMLALPTCMTVKFAESPAGDAIVVSLDQGTPTVGLTLDIHPSTARTHLSSEVSIAFFEMHALWDALPIHSLVLSSVSIFSEECAVGTPAQLWTAFGALRGVTRVRVQTTRLLLSLLAALEHYPDLFLALARVEFERKQRSKIPQADLERSRSVFGSTRA